MSHQSHVTLFTAPHLMQAMMTLSPNPKGEQHGKSQNTPKRLVQTEGKTEMRPTRTTASLTGGQVHNDQKATSSNYT